MAGPTTIHYDACLETPHTREASGNQPPSQNEASPFTVAQRTRRWDHPAKPSSIFKCTKKTCLSLRARDPLRQTPKVHVLNCNVSQSSVFPCTCSVSNPMRCAPMQCVPFALQRNVLCLNSMSSSVKVLPVENSLFRNLRKRRRSQTRAAPFTEPEADLQVECRSQTRAAQLAEPQSHHFFIILLM
jgi:hypothetical protein